MKAAFAAITLCLLCTAARASDPLEATLIALEKRSWEAWKSRDAAYFREFLSEDHVEMGAGGPAGKGAVVGFVGSPACVVKSYAIGQFTLTVLDERAALLVYRAEQDTICAGSPVPSPAWASSLYVQRGGRWVNALYQQTPAAPPVSRPPSTLWGRLARGAYAVGFTTIQARDRARPAFAPEPEAQGRPMRIAVWYPALEGVGEQRTLRTYVELGPGVEAFAKEPIANGIESARLQAALDTRLVARDRATPVEGRFPLVLFLHAAPWSASVMSEYLASHGFVVAAFESKGTREPEYRLSRENLDTLVRDAQFVIARMRHEPNVGTKLGVVGMSNGAIAAVALQLSGTVPGAIVSLDGGIGEGAGATYLRERSAGDARRLAAPILHLYTPDNKYLDLAPLRSWDAAPRMLVSLAPLRHADFLAYAALEIVIPGAFGPAPREAAAGFDAVCRYALRFLQWHLAGDETARRLLDTPPEALGMPARLVAVESLPAR